MIWLQSPPWGRWALAVVIAIAAVWVEMRPDPRVDHPFAISEIQIGDALDEADVEWREVPTGLFEPVDLDGVASRAIQPGEPILRSSVDDGDGSVPTGWWIVETEVPPGAAPGDKARVVILDTGATADAVVVSARSDDPLGSSLGAIAVEPARAAEAAAAAAQGRIALMIETG